MPLRVMDASAEIAAAAATRKAANPGTAPGVTGVWLSDGFLVVFRNASMAATMAGEIHRVDRPQRSSSVRVSRVDQQCGASVGQARRVHDIGRRRLSRLTESRSVVSDLARRPIEHRRRVVSVGHERSRGKSRQPDPVPALPTIPHVPSGLVSGSDVLGPVATGTRVTPRFPSAFESRLTVAASLRDDQDQMLFSAVFGQGYSGSGWSRFHIPAVRQRMSRPQN